MFRFIKLFKKHSDYEEYINSDDKILPNVSLCGDDNNCVHYNPIPHNYSQDYLTFVALENGTFTFTPKNSNVISYSTDNGENWTQGNSVTVSNGDKILWKGEMTPASSQGIGTFSATGNFDIEGNAMSLLFGDNYKEQIDLTGKNYVFYQLFNGNTKVVNAENLSLPATTLANHCYNSMFYGCTSLEIAPELPAMTLAFYCYNTMFCGCTNLRYIKSMFTTTPGMMYTNSWVSGVAATGTFVKNSAAEWDVSGVDGIPEGWTVETASIDYVTDEGL